MTMPRQSPEMSLQEHPGTKFQDLTAAQRYSLNEAASDLVAIIQTLLDAGILVSQNGKIIPSAMKG